MQLGQNLCRITQLIIKYFYRMGNETAQKHLIKGNQFFAQKDYEQADYHYQKMIKAFPTWSNGYFTYVKFLRSQNRIEDIDKTYRNALKVIPNCSTVHYNYAVFLDKQGRKEEAKQHYINVIKMEQTNPKAHHNLAIILKNQQQFQRAQQHYKAALKLNPNDSETCFSYAILLQKINKLERAEQLYRTAIYNDPSHLSAHYNFGLLLKQTGRYKEAENIYKRSLQLDPISQDIYFNYGILCECQQDQARAIQMYKNALELNPNHIKSMYNMAVLCQKFGKLNDAAAGYKKILAIDPQNCDAAFNMAILLKKQGDAGRNYAQKYYQIASVRQGDSPLYLCSRSENLFFLDRKKEAFEHLDKAEKIMLGQSREHLQKRNEISDENYEYIELVLEELKKFRRITDIQSKIQEEDRELLNRCQSEFFSFIEVSGSTQQSDNRQSFLDFDHKYDQRFKELEQKYQHLLELNLELTQKLNHVAEKALWEERFDELLIDLEENGQEKVADFARNLSWMLSQSIRSCRAVGLGLVKGGGSMAQSTIGEVTSKISSVCGLAAHVPLIGQVFHLFSLIGKHYVDMDEQHCNRKIIEVTSRLHTDSKVTKAVAAAIEEIITDKYFLNWFQKNQSQGLKKNVLNSFKEVTNELMEKITGVKVQPEEQLPFTYCLQIMRNLLFIDGRPSNPLLLAVRRILSEYKPEKR